MPERVLGALSVPTFEDRWRRILQRAERSTLIAERGKQIIGFASVGPCLEADELPKRTGELYGLYLVPEVWGRGMGYLLWSAARDELLARQFTGTTLWVLEANTRARAFYEAVGFREDAGIIRALDREGVVLPEVRYRMAHT